MDQRRSPVHPRPQPGVLAAIERRQALPWLISFGFHALLLLVSLFVVVARNPHQLPLQPVEVALESGFGVSSGDGSTSASFPADQPLPALARVPLPPHSEPPVPRPGKPVSSLGLRPRLEPIGSGSMPSAVGRAPSGSAPAAPLSVPSVQDVLADMPSAPSTAYDAEAEYGWEGSAPRAVLVRRTPRFPPVLSAGGVEVECAARITVAPAGNVTRVEIVRSSGYTEIDASVEAALREFLFSRVEGRKDAVGTITFRFRLEKRY